VSKLMPDDYFLRIHAIEGDSLDAKHKGEIDVDSWSWGENQVGASGGGGGGGGGAGKVQIHDLHVVTDFGKAGPTLFLACASGEHLPEAVLTARKAGKDATDYLRWTFGDVLISSYQTGGSSQGGITDQVSLSFGRLAVEYRPQRPDGTPGPPITAGWDVRKNAKL
jgi:type VI secretion system secreted protein Hcp